MEAFKKICIAVFIMELVILMLFPITYCSGQSDWNPVHVDIRDTVVGVGLMKIYYDTELEKQVAEEVKENYHVIKYYTLNHFGRRVYFKEEWILKEED